MGNKFRYQEYLDKYKNCPANDCHEKDFECFRWVHRSVSELDFLPVPFIRDVAPRKLEDNDLGCQHYGLSVYDTIKSARDSYNHLCERMRDHLVERFKMTVGVHLANLEINGRDGVSDLPNKKTGHFSFYVYSNEDFKFLDKIKGLFDIFV